MSSYASTFPGHRLGPGGTLAAILEDEDLVLYDNFFSVRASKEYRREIKQGERKAKKGVLGIACV